MLWQICAVAVGGALGTLARFGIDTLLPHEPLGALSVATVVVNVAGSFLLGLASAAALRRSTVPDWLRHGVTIGILGSFTTLSAVSLNVVAAGVENRWADAILAPGLSLAGGLLAAWGGIRVGSTWVSPRRTSSGDAA